MNMMVPTLMMSIGVSLMGLPKRARLALTPVIAGTLLRTAFQPDYHEDRVLDVAISQLDTIH